MNRDKIETWFSPVAQEFFLRRQQVNLATNLVTVARSNPKWKVGMKMLVHYQHGKPFMALVDYRRDGHYVFVGLKKEIAKLDPRAS